ncbi:MAG: NAD(P)-dependent oxidoreductase [Ilumatobacteraceae bacterium]
MADPAELARSRRIDDGFPVVVRLQGRPVLVVGGGVIALRKTEGLLASGATVRVVSPEFVDGFEALGVERVQRRYEPSDLDGAWLVVAATNDAVVQQQIFDECEARGVFWQRRRRPRPVQLRPARGRAAVAR